jgi:hypothetical protein
MVYRAVWYRAYGSMLAWYNHALILLVMTDSPQKKGRGAGTNQSTKKQKKPTTQQPAAGKKVSQRAPSKKQSDTERKEQLLIRVVSAGIGLAVFFIIVGIIYSQVWLPSQAIAQVNSTELTRREYWQEYHDILATQVIQNLQFVAMFGDNEQIAAQFADRSPAINQQAEIIRDEPENDELIKQWQENQLVIQGAQALGISVTDGEITQRMVQDLVGFLDQGQVGQPETPLMSTPVITTTDSLTDTGSLTDTLSPTPESSPTPTATPTVDEATTQMAQIFDKAYELYQAELEQAQQDLQRDFDPQFSQEDFQQAMMEQYRVQLLREKIQEHLVAEETFELDPTPDRVQARQIFLSVDSPITDTQQLTMTEELSATVDASFAERLPEAEEIVGALRDGADFVAMVAEHSEDLGSREQGGDMGAFDEEGNLSNGATTYPPAVVDAAFALSDEDEDEDAVSDPVRSPFGWHILQVTEVQTATLEQQLQQARTEAFDTWLEEQREQATIKRMNDAAEGTAIPTPTETPTPQPTYMPGPPTAAPTREMEAPPVPDMIPTPDIVTTPTPDTGDDDAGEESDPLLDTEVLTTTDDGDQEDVDAETETDSNDMDSDTVDSDTATPMDETDEDTEDSVTNTDVLTEDIESVESTEPITP